MDKIKKDDDNVVKVDMKKMTKPVEDNVVKLDLSKPPVSEKEEEEEVKDADQEQETTDVVTDEPTEALQELVEEVSQREETVQDEQPALEEVTDEVEEETVEQITEKVEEAIVEAEATGKPLPENIQKLVDFMEETGGTLEDYVNLNKDYSQLDNLTALTEYYRITKPHLSVDEIDFLIEDSFNYDEELDDEKEIKRKKLALKEQVASAKAYLDGQKSKYYDQIKAGSNLPPEAQKAMDFFNRYNKESEEASKAAEKAKSTFLQKTNNVFNDKFKGFEYNVGDKKYRFNVNNAEEIKAAQSDINNFVKKFLAEDNTMSDAKGYHKSLFTAMNADAVAKHFYEQGRADAIKDSVAKSKNVNMDPRQSHGEVKVGGTKFRVLSGENSNDFKIKMKRK
jgi:hypothetical protein